MKMVANMHNVKGPWGRLGTEWIKMTGNSVINIPEPRFPSHYLYLYERYHEAQDREPEANVGRLQHLQWRHVRHVKVASLAHRASIE